MPTNDDFDTGGPLPRFLAEQAEQEFGNVRDEGVVLAGGLILTEGVNSSASWLESSSWDKPVSTAVAACESTRVAAGSAA